MSGQGGGVDSGGGGGGGGDTGAGSCSTLRYRTTLSSPAPKIVEQLKLKDILELEQRKRPDGPLYALYEGRIAGSIAGALLVRLLKCIEEGYEFEAVVTRVTGGNVEVEVKPKGA